MSKYDYNLSEQLDHIAYMFNVRTKRKAYENFIVNAIYTKIANPNLIPITQQYVKDPNDARGYYLLDLYFPQINFGVEVDERQHLAQAHQERDKIRAEDIREAIECEEFRIPIYEEIDENTSRKRTYSEICEDIDKVVFIVNKKITEIGGVKWETNEERRDKVQKRGVFHAADDVSYDSITQVYNMCGGSRTRKGEKVEALRRCYYKLNSEYRLWVPTLTVESEILAGLRPIPRYVNILNDDKSIITEKTHDRHFAEHNKEMRVVFMRMKDKFGRGCIKFIGVYKFEKMINRQTRTFRRCATSVEISKLLP